MEGFTPLHLMGAEQNVFSRRPRTFSNPTFFLLVLLLSLGGCFDYEEHLRIHATGAVDTQVHTLIPPWLRELPQASGAFYPASATALAQQVGDKVRPVFTTRDGEVVDGFEGRIPSIARLDTKMIRHTLVFSKGGGYSFRVTLQLPPDFAAAVSEAVARRTAEMPRLPVSSRERVREAALNELGYRLKVEFPGAVTGTNGTATGSQVFWKVPVRRLMAGNPVDLTASGRLSVPARIARKLGFSLSF